MIGLATVLASTSSVAQPGIGIGSEAQLYPAGLIAAAVFQTSVGARDAVALHAAYNLTDRRDFGRHDSEEGNGPGAGASWHHVFGDGTTGVTVGARMDFWRLTIDWRDNPNRTGTTKVTVWQPTARVGYQWVAGSGHWSFGPTVGFGLEVNVSTTGEAVGEGPILLGGFRVVYGL